MQIFKCGNIVNTMKLLFNSIKINYKIVSVLFFWGEYSIYNIYTNHFYTVGFSCPVVL